MTPMTPEIFGAICGLAAGELANGCKAQRS